MPTQVQIIAPRERRKLQKFIRTFSKPDHTIYFHAHIPCCVGYGSSMHIEQIEAITSFLITLNIEFTFYLNPAQGVDDILAWKNQLNEYIKNNPESAVAIFLNSNHIKELSEWRKSDIWLDAQKKYQEFRERKLLAVEEILNNSILNFKKNHVNYISRVENSKAREEDQARLDANIRDHMITETIDVISWFDSKDDTFNILLSPDPLQTSMLQVIDSYKSVSKIAPIFTERLKFDYATPEEREELANTIKQLQLKKDKANTTSITRSLSLFKNDRLQVLNGLESSKKLRKISLNEAVWYLTQKKRAEMTNDWIADSKKDATLLESTKLLLSESYYCNVFKYYMNLLKNDPDKLIEEYRSYVENGPKKITLR